MAGEKLERPTRYMPPKSALSRLDNFGPVGVGDRKGTIVRHIHTSAAVLCLTFYISAIQYMSFFLQQGGLVGVM